MTTETFITHTAWLCLAFGIVFVSICPRLDALLSANVFTAESQLMTRHFGLALLFVGSLCLASLGSSDVDTDVVTTDSLAKMLIAWHVAVVAAFVIELGWLGAFRQAPLFTRISAQCGFLWHVLVLTEGLSSVGYFGHLENICQLFSLPNIGNVPRYILAARDTVVIDGTGSFYVIIFCSAAASLFGMSRCTRNNQRRRGGIDAESLRGELVVITGAAGEIGREISLVFARQGARVSLWDIRDGALEEVAIWLVSQGISRDNVMTSVVDVSDAESVANAAEALNKSEGGKVPRVVVSNAAVMRGKTLLDYSDEEIRLDFSVNVLAAFWVHRRFLRQMIEDGKQHGRRAEGVLVTIGSIMAELPAARQAEYCASKAALSQFHECLRWELKKANGGCHESDRTNIRSLLIQPYAVKTSMISGASLLGEGGSTSAHRRFALMGKALPPLEPAAVAERIFEAVLRGEERVYIPTVLGWVPLILQLLPQTLRENILGLCGAYDGMDGFCGNAPGR